MSHRHLQSWPKEPQGLPLHAFPLESPSQRCSSSSTPPRPEPPWSPRAHRAKPRHHALFKAPGGLTLPSSPVPSLRTSPHNLDPSHPHLSLQDPRDSMMINSVEQLLWPVGQSQPATCFCRLSLMANSLTWSAYGCSPAVMVAVSSRDRGKMAQKT